MPVGIQRLRKKGWRLPDGAVCVTRGTRWGNPWRVERIEKALHHAAEGSAVKDDVLWDAVFYTRLAEDKSRNLPLGALATEIAVRLFRAMGDAFAVQDPEGFKAWIGPLTGHDLACFCPLHAPCHRNVLLDWANPASERVDLDTIAAEGGVAHLHLPVHFGGSR